MADISKDHPAGATGDYSATKAPENEPHVTSTETTSDKKLKPGGAHGTPADVGMSGLHREDVPSMASHLDPADDEKPGKERKGVDKD
jgi:hypothetical protein